jgi:hypothetical protein
VLEIPFYKPILKDIINIIGFKKEYKDQVTDQENRGPYNGPSKRFFFIPEVHKIPGNIIGFYQGKNNKDPVQQFHPYKGIGDQNMGFSDPQGHFYGGNYREEY